MEDEERNKSTDKPWLFKKGNPGSPGRPKGKSLKEYSRDYLAKMTDEERMEFLEGIPKESIWKMSEGNPDTKVDIPPIDKVILSPEALALALEYEERLKNKDATGSNINNSLDNK